MLFTHKYASKKLAISIFVSWKSIENFNSLCYVIAIHALILLLCLIYICLLCYRFCKNCERNKWLNLGLNLLVYFIIL